jgi:hypothetical protein
MAGTPAILSEMDTAGVNNPITAESRKKLERGNFLGV